MPARLKIISGGQTGADRAALDFAIALGIPHGGWCPKGRLAEGGTIGARYSLKETPSDDYLQRTEWNVRDSDGTVVFSIEPVLRGGSKETVAFACKHNRPVVHISRQGSSVAPERALVRFVQEHGIQVLNVAGPRAAEEPHVYGFVKEVLTKALAQLQERAPIRLLMSERDESITAMVKAFVEHVAQGAVTVLTPPTAEERDLVRLAAEQQWDFALLFANNVVYESGDRSPEGLERDAVGLVARLVQDFQRPVIVLYGYPDLVTFPVRVRDAGAAAVLRAPPSRDEMKEAIEICLPVSSR